MIVALFLGSSIAGCLALQWWQRPSYPIIVWTFLCLSMCLAYAWHFFMRGGIHACALIAGVLCALLAVERNAQPWEEHDVGSATNNIVTMEGVIADIPDRRFSDTRYTLETESVTDGMGSGARVKGRAMAIAANWPIFHMGERVICEGKRQNMRSKIEETYLRLRGIHAKMTCQAMRRSAVALFAMRSSIAKLREHIEQQINVLFPEPHASLLAGILIGSNRGLPPETAAAMKSVGLTHIIVVSGFNVTLVAMAISSMLFWLPMKLRVVPCLCAIAAFAVLTGAGAPVLRACLMGGMGLCAVLVGRASQLRMTMLWSLWAMTMWNPASLWHDMGFQLSFLALLGLTEFGGIVKEMCGWMPTKLGIKEQWSTTVAAQICAAPWIAYHFGQASLIAPVANVLMCPIIPMAMLFGTAAIVADAVHPMLGQWMVYPAWVCLEWIVRGVMLLSKIPYASVQVVLDRGSMVIYYVCIGGIAWFQSGITIDTHRVTQDQRSAELGGPPPADALVTQTHGRERSCQVAKACQTAASVV